MGAAPSDGTAAADGAAAADGDAAGDAIAPPECDSAVHATGTDRSARAAAEIDVAPVGCRGTSLLTPRCCAPFFRLDELPPAAALAPPHDVLAAFRAAGDPSSSTVACALSCEYLRSFAAAGGPPSSARSSSSGVNPEVGVPSSADTLSFGRCRPAPPATLFREGAALDDGPFFACARSARGVPHRRHFVRESGCSSVHALQAHISAPHDHTRMKVSSGAVSVTTLSSECLTGSLPPHPLPPDWSPSSRHTTPQAHTSDDHQESSITFHVGG